MKNSVLKQSILVVGASALFVAALWGCGGGGSTISADGGGGGGGGGATTRGLSFAVQWPDDTRLVPNNATKVDLRIRFVGSSPDASETAASNNADAVIAACADGNCTVTIEKDAEAPAGSVAIGAVPLGAYTMKADAKNSTDQVLASNASPGQPDGDNVAVVEGAGTQTITLVMGSTVKSFDVRFRTVTEDAAGTWSGFTNLSPVGPDLDILFDSVEGGLIEVEASAKNAAGNVLNLRYQGTDPGVEELTINLNGSPLRLDQLDDGTTASKVTGVGTLAANQAVNNIEVVYKDGGGPDTAETTVVAKARLTGAKTFQSLAAGVLVQGPAASSRFDDLDFDHLGGLRILSRPSGGGDAQRDRGGIAWFDANNDYLSYFDLVANENHSEYTPDGSFGRFSTYYGSNPQSTIGVGAKDRSFRLPFPSGTVAYTLSPDDDWSETAALPNRSGVIVADGTTGKLTVVPTGSLPRIAAPFSTLAAAFDGSLTPILGETTNLTDLVLFTAAGTSLKKFRSGTEEAGAFPAQPANVVDIAGRDGFLFVLLSNKILRVYTSGGVLVSEGTLTDLTDPKALAIGKRIVGAGGGYPVAIIDGPNSFRRTTWELN